MGTMISRSAAEPPEEPQPSVAFNLKESAPNSARPIDDACLITSLSTELIYHIIDFIPPESHLDFACTCRRLAECSSTILMRHQKAYSKYRIASDILPTTVPTLLRSAFGRADPLLAWHVRLIEIWYDRTSWLDWKPLQFYQLLHEEDMDMDSVSWKWEDDELSEYLEDIEDQFDALVESGDEDARMDAREQFEDGADGILKMLLIAFCPRLRDVKFITQEHREQSTLGWLKRLIQGSILYGSHWPPGISNIRDIAVGVESDTWMSKEQPSGLDPANKSMETFSTLLRLPRIRSIYYNDLRRNVWHDRTDYESCTLIPPRSSTVKHIFLDDCSKMPRKFSSALSQAPLALETFTLRVGDCDDSMNFANALVAELCFGQASSLHTLMFYGPYDHHQIHGYGCSVYRNEELEDAQTLKAVAIHVSDVERDCFWKMACKINPGHDNMAYEEQRRWFVKWFCELAFPRTIERLVLWGKQSEHFLSQCKANKGHFLMWLEDALVAAIESRRWLDGIDVDADGERSDAKCEVYYPKLKAVYLEDIESGKRGYDDDDGHDGPRTDKLLFQRLVQVGKEAGIDIHTLTNRMPTQHTHDFPTVPDKYDLRSGPWWECRSEIEDWVFDVYKGRRVPPGCGKCGKCEGCLKEYSEELWRSLDGETETMQRSNRLQTCTEQGV